MQNVKLASFAEEGIGLAAGRDLQVRIQGQKKELMVLNCITRLGLVHITSVLFLNLWVFNLDQAGDVALKVPENYTVTSADLVNHPVLSGLAAGNFSFLLTTVISIHPVPKSYIT